ncbi:hypothetical protein [Streptomyces sp. NBC_01198]|uniref:hypothetical protein n=1 Tax=Streptomyces sp. NBC_01198 TaxID=2903769 RepID=UPI002E0FAA5D|nr:hypothetical protein OG702_11980 [Streptomyces sp. NBC_01198]
MRRRRGRRPDSGGPEASGRWGEWCGAAGAGRPAEVDALLRRLLALPAEGAARERAAALAALTAAPPRLLLLLDRAARTGGPVPAGAGDVLGLLLRSFAPDGHVREAAVAGLAGCGGPAAVAGLALRSADWVDAVRARATAALVVRSAPEEVAAAVRVLLRLAGRSRTGDLLADYRRLLCRPPHRRAVRALVVDADPAARRFGVVLALELGEYARGDLLRTALRDRDQVCRTLCAQRLLDLDPEQAGRLLLARDAAVREIAVAALPADVPATRLVAPLADRARMVRAQARWQLYGRGEPPSAVYRRQLGRAGRTTPVRLLAGLVAGLGECGDAGDVPALARLLDPRRPSPPMVRRAAVRAVGRLAPQGELVGLLGPLAMDPDPGVARAVFEALAARAPGEVPVEIRWIGGVRPEAAVRRAAARIGAAKSPQVRAVGGVPRYEQSGHSPR